MAKTNDPLPATAEKPPQQPTATEQAAKIAELEAKLAEAEKEKEGRRTTRGLSASIQALAEVDKSLQKLKAEDPNAVPRVVQWIAQEWLPQNKVVTDKPKE